MRIIRQRDAFLIKRIKKTSRRKKWLSGILFWIFIFQVFAQIGLIMQNRYPHVEFSELHEIEKGESMRLTLRELSDYVLTYEILQGLERRIVFVKTSDNSYIPVSMEPASFEPGQFFGHLEPLRTVDEIQEIALQELADQGIIEQDSGQISNQATEQDSNIILERLEQELIDQGATPEEIAIILSFSHVIDEMATDSIATGNLGIISNYGYVRDIMESELAEQGATEEEMAMLLDAEYVFRGSHMGRQDIVRLILSAIAGLWALKVWWVSRRNLKKPFTHRVFRSFAREGGEVENFNQFEKEISVHCLSGFANLLITENWLLYNGYLKLQLRHISEVVLITQIKTQDWGPLTRWATRKQDVIIGFVDKRQWRVNFKRSYGEILAFKETMKERLPHIVCDENDKENFALWTDRPDGILEKVGEYKFHERKAKKVATEEVERAEQSEKKGRRRMRIVSDSVPKPHNEPLNNTQNLNKEPPTGGWERRPSPRWGIVDDDDE
jgi:hypothetical protein